MAATRPPISYDEFVAEQETAKIPFTVGGETFHILPPDLMSDEDATAFFKFIAMEAKGETYDVVEFARLLVDDYDGFAAAGGTALGLVSYMDRIAADTAKVTKAEQGVTEGEDAAS